jgi:Ca2+-binding RTX toxin-like protein
VLDALQGSFTVNGVTSVGNVFSAVAAFAGASNPAVSVTTTQIVSYFSWIVEQYGKNASVSSITQLQAQLDTALQDFFTGARPDLNLTATGQPQLPTSPLAVNSVAFQFSPTDTSTAQQVLSELITGAQIPEATRGTLPVVGFSPQLYTAFVNNSAPINSADQSLIGAAPDSQQWIALVIAAYNGFPKGAGAGLRMEDPAETWYRLRYTNSIPITTGVAARNYIESTIFGLNGGASSVTEALALQDYETLTEHRPSIISFEQQFGADPDGAIPLSGFTPKSALGTANADIVGFGGNHFISSMAALPSSLQGLQQIQTLAQIFNPAAEEIANVINASFANAVPLIGILNDSLSGSFDVRSTDILIAPDSSDISNGFAGPTQDQVEALDSPSANHILIGPDTAYCIPSQIGSPTTQAPIALIGGLGNDLLIAGAGNESLVAGTGNDTLIGGETPFAAGPAGNDTLEGGAGPDVFVFDAPPGAGITETIRPVNQSGSVEILDGSSLSVLDGSSAIPTLSADGNTVTWSGGSSDDGSGVSYSYDKITGTLTITGGILGSGTGANAIETQDFNLSAALNGGFLGISLEKEAFLNFTANKGVDPPAPDFIAGTTQSYTFSTDGPSDTAQTVTLMLSGVDPSEFDVTVTGQTVQRNSDGSSVSLCLLGKRTLRIR